MSSFKPISSIGIKTVNLGANNAKINNLESSNAKVANLNVENLDIFNDFDLNTKEIHLGYEAGKINQGDYGIAIGNEAGYENQGTNAIAIGNEAGYENQGTNAIAIGNQAGTTNQASNSIVLNASGNEINPGSSGFFVKPIDQNETTSLATNLLQYDTMTSEISYTNVTKILQLIYPVGSIYCNRLVTTSPEVLLGFGTWVQIDDTGNGYFLRTIKSSETLGTTGGSDSHNHQWYKNGGASTSFDHQISLSTSGDPSLTYGIDGADKNLAASGVNYIDRDCYTNNHDNIPKYYAVIMWYRTG